MSKTDETWVPLSRGLESHIPDMNPQACRVYIYLLMKASPCGDNIGTYNIFIGQLASDLKMHRVTLQKVIHEHLLNKYIKISGGENQYKITKFTILKYKTVYDFACSDKTTTKATSTEQPRLQAGNKQVTSTVENSSNNTDLQNANNTISKELNNSKKNTTTTEKIIFENGKLINFKNDFLNKCKNAYPALDINQEIKKAELWLIANPKNTKSNYERFLINWFARNQDRAVKTQKKSLPYTPGCDHKIQEYLNSED